MATTGKATMSDVGLLIVRIAGVGMAVHGWPKVMDAIGHANGEPWKFVDGVAALGFPFPVAFAWAAALSELVCASLIALGVYTRVNALFLSVTMFVAAFIRHADDDFNVKEKALLYLVICLGLVFMGGGRLTVDSFWRKR